VIEIAIPVLNEEATLSRNIERVLDYVSRNKVTDSEIRLVIADNGSTDSTQDVGKELAGKHREVRYLHQIDRGVGRALKAAWQSSQANIVGYMDLDLATDLRHLESLKMMEEARFDILTGSRLLPGAKVLNRSVFRSVVSRIFNRIVRLYFNTRFSDGMCGFKFLRKDVLKRLLESGAISDGWFFCTEILIVAEHLNLRVGEIPVCWKDDGNSKVRIAKLSFEYLVAMRRLRSFLTQQRS
jgi:glycosyltransferase involved in cell wall biosynthesis